MLIDQERETERNEYIESEIHSEDIQMMTNKQTQKTVFIYVQFHFPFIISFRYFLLAYKQVFFSFQCSTRYAIFRVSER